MTSLGIIDTDLCMWAGTVTPEMMEAAYLSRGHPVIKAKPAPVEGIVPTGSEGWLCTLNRWVDAHPWLALSVLAGSCLLFRRK